MAVSNCDFECPYIEEDYIELEVDSELVEHISNFVYLGVNISAWLPKMFMCSKPDQEISQCAAQIWGLGRILLEIFRYFRAPYAIIAISKY